MLPYLYTTAYRAHTDGAPIAAPAFFADPSDASLRGEDRAFLIGEDVLAVCDVLPRGESDPRGRAAPPSGGWKRFSVVDEDPELPALYLRPGRAIAVDPVVQNTTESPDGARTIIASLDADGRAEGLLYEDAGDGFGFEGGAFRLSRVMVEATGDSGAGVRLQRVAGDWTPESEREHAVKLV